MDPQVPREIHRNENALTHVIRGKSHSEAPRIRTSRTICQHYHPGTFHFVCNAKPMWVFFIENKEMTSLKKIRKRRYSSSNSANILINEHSLKIANYLLRENIIILINHQFDVIILSDSFRRRIGGSRWHS